MSCRCSCSSGLSGCCRPPSTAFCVYWGINLLKIRGWKCSNRAFCDDVSMMQPGGVATCNSYEGFFLQTAHDANFFHLKFSEAVWTNKLHWRLFPLCAPPVTVTQMLHFFFWNRELLWDKDLTSETLNNVKTCKNKIQIKCFQDAFFLSVCKKYCTTESMHRLKFVFFYQKNIFNEWIMDIMIGRAPLSASHAAMWASVCDRTINAAVSSLYPRGCFQ